MEMYGKYHSEEEKKADPNHGYKAKARRLALNTALSPEKKANKCGTCGRAHTTNNHASYVYRTGNLG
jgi:hypothetical protein